MNIAETELQRIVSMELALNEIRRLASWHYDEDADYYDESPDDMTAHINGLIVRLAAPFVEKDE